MGTRRRGVLELLLQGGRIATTQHVERGTAVIERDTQGLDRFAHIRRRGAEAGVVLVQEVAAVLHDVMKRKVYLAQIGFVVGCHQPCTQMIDRGKALVALPLCFGRNEQRTMVIAACFASIRWHQARLLQPDKECRVDCGHLFFKKPLQKIEAPAAALIAPALSALEPRIGSRLTFWEHPAAPSGLAVLHQQFAVDACNRPANGRRPKVEADIVISLNVAELHSVLHLCYSKHVLITSQDDTASQNTALPKMPSGAV